MTTSLCIQQGFTAMSPAPDTGWERHTGVGGGGGGGGSKVTTLMVTTSTAMQIPQSEAMLVPLKKMHKIIYHRNLYPWPVIIYNINIEEMDDKDHLSDIRDKNGDLLRSYVKGPNKSIKTFWFYMRHRTAITGVSFRKFIVELYFWW